MTIEASRSLDGADAAAAEAVLPPDPSAPARARRTVAAYCGSTGIPAETCETAVLLTSEAVTNAVVHGRGPVRLALHADARVLRVAVTDDDPAHPCVRTAAEDDTGGRGVQILDLLAAAWGVADRASGKTVWFELPVALPTATTDQSRGRKP